MSKTIEKQKAPCRTPRTVPKEWRRVAGMLKGRLTVTPVSYQRRTRKEWDTREKRTARLVTK